MEAEDTMFKHTPHLRLRRLLWLANDFSSLSPTSNLHRRSRVRTERGKLFFLTLKRTDDEEE